MEKYKRKAVFSSLKDYDVFCGEYDFMEVTEWSNGEGFDVEVAGKTNERFQLTYGCYEALKDLVKEIEKDVK